MSELGGGEAPTDRLAGCGWGGKRAGAGRPPGRSGGPTGGDPGQAMGLIGVALDHARDLLGATLRDETKPVELRTCCAMALLIGGKARGGRRRRDGESAGSAGQAEAGGNPIDPGQAGEPIST